MTQVLPLPANAITDPELSDKNRSCAPYSATNAGSGDIGFTSRLALMVVSVASTQITHAIDIYPD